MNLNPIYMDASRHVTTEEVQDFKTNHLNLNLDIQSALLQGNRSPIGDGVFHYEGYLKARLKILWLMKEPYDTVKGDNVDEIKTGGWYFSGSDMYINRKFGRDRTTWYPIINASHAILTGQSIWNQNQRMSKQNKDLSDVLSHIAYINIQKLASLTREKTNNTVIQEAFLQNISWVQRQIDLLNPDVIIGANTLNDHVFTYFKLKGNNFSVDNSYVVNNRLFIRTNHPSQRSKKAETYINHILASIGEWQKSR